MRRILVNASNRRFRRHRVAEQPGDPPETPVDGPADLVGERTALLAALRQLPPRQRAVIVLRYWADLTDAQVAATARLLAGHGAQPALAGPGQAPGQPGPRGR